MEIEFEDMNDEDFRAFRIENDTRFDAFATPGEQIVYGPETSKEIADYYERKEFTGD